MVGIADGMEEAMIPNSRIPAPKWPGNGRWGWGVDFVSVEIEVASRLRDGLLACLPQRLLETAG